MKEVKSKYKRVPNSLRKYRKISGYTQQEVATLLGARNAAMISRWENGNRFPGYPNILRLSALYSTVSEALYLDLSRIVKEEIRERRQAMEKNCKPSP